MEKKLFFESPDGSFLSPNIDLETLLAIPTGLVSPQQASRTLGKRKHSWVSSEQSNPAILSRLQGFDALETKKRVESAPLVKGSFRSSRDPFPATLRSEEGSKKGNLPEFTPPMLPRRSQSPSAAVKSVDGDDVSSTPSSSDSVLLSCFSCLSPSEY